MPIKRGVSRTVLLVGRWAVKLPSWRNGAIFWLRGLLANCLEAERWQLSHHPHLARVIWCAPLGVIQVMVRYDRLVGVPLPQGALAVFPFIQPAWCIDNNGANIAVADDGRLILIDYGDDGMYLDIGG